MKKSLFGGMNKFVMLTEQFFGEISAWGKIFSSFKTTTMLPAAVNSSNLINKSVRSSARWMVVIKMLQGYF